jgi:hypothetical protein
MEIHPKVIGDGGISEIFALMHGQGLIYDARLSIGQVVVFSRA